ncbi:unnamed protein product [Tilletia controversa]|nr:unnamed protein product [Tilletia controversa]
MEDRLAGVAVQFSASCRSDSSLYSLKDKRIRLVSQPAFINGLFCCFKTCYSRSVTAIKDAPRYQGWPRLLNRPNGFKAAGTPSHSSAASGDRVFDEEGNEHISVGELRSFLTSLGEKLENKEVDELLKTIPTLYFHTRYLQFSLPHRRPVQNKNI